MTILGKYLYDRGGVRAEYELALDQDPFRKESLEAQKKTEEHLRAIRFYYGRLLSIQPKK